MTTNNSNTRKRFKQDLRYGTHITSLLELWEAVEPLIESGEYCADELQVHIDKFEKQTGEHGKKAISQLCYMYGVKNVPEKLATAFGYSR